MSSRLDRTQAVSVVTKTEMEDRGAVRLVDALDGVAGVNNTLGEPVETNSVIKSVLTHSMTCIVMVA
ncbi:Plug domain-containing protein [Vibrio chagasii]|nr:Plug domain-containing protein [Vibrio chagasii]